MIMPFSRILSQLFLIAFTLTIPLAKAALPLEADGDKLPSLAPMLEQVTPAVVNIATEGRIRQTLNPLFSDPFFQRFFQLPDRQVERKTSSLGSGVIVDAERGLVLTNNHVIANAIQITVTLRDGRQLEAEVIGTDPETDIAVIKIPAQGLSGLKTADSEKLRVGDFVVAIGNPFGLGQTVTSGIISALSRSGLDIGGYEDFIQTDASINPGNSGGALVNLRGELVGINTAIFSRSGGNIGIGFAIPINLALQVTEQLVESGEVKRSYLGVSMQDINPALAEAFGLKSRQGAIISRIIEDSPAEKAGLQVGDIVLSSDGRRIKSAADLRNRIGLLPIGETTEFDVLRDGRQMKFTVTVEESRLSGNAPRPYNELLTGVTVSDIEFGSPYYGRVEGVIVSGVDRGTPAWRSGLLVADIITSVNRLEVRNLDEFLAAVDNRQRPLVLRIIRGNSAMFLVING